MNNLEQLNSFLDTNNNKSDKVIAIRKFIQESQGEIINGISKNQVIEIFKQRGFLDKKVQGADVMYAQIHLFTFLHKDHADHHDVFVLHKQIKDQISIFCQRFSINHNDIDIV